MTEHDGYDYHVFISYSPADREWVSTVLLPRLEQAGLDVAIDYRTYVVGRPQIANIEDAVKASRRTIVVLSPDWVASEWNAFEALLLRTEDPAATRRKLLPLRLRPCDLPDGLAKLKLDVADLTAERYKEAQLKRVVRDVEDVVPVPLPASVRDWGAWRRWLRRYRGEVRWGIGSMAALWLVAALLLHTFPFRWLFEWEPIAPALPTNAWTLHNTGTALLVGAENSRAGCNRKEQGIWYRPLNGDRFLPSELSVSLCVPDWKTPSPSIVKAFASKSQEVYALTSYSEVLISTDGGVRFDVYAPPPPPATEAQGAHLLGVQFQNPTTIWAAGATDGLWRFRAGSWLRMDGGGAGSCSGLPFAQVTALLVDDNRVLIGTDRKGLWLTSDGGIHCQPVFDVGPRSQYTFESLGIVGSGPPGRYLALAYDTQVDGGAHLLLDLCSRPGQCTDQRWQGEPLAWRTGTNATQVLTQDDSAGETHWYVVARPFHVFQGVIGDPDHWQTTLFLRHPAMSAEVALARAAPGQMPFLLVANGVYRQRTKE
jgi:hypothetical protein